MDRTYSNNADGTGLNLIFCLANRGKFSPVVDVESNYFFGDNRPYPNGRSFFQPKKGVYNLFAGAAYRFTRRLEAAVGAGPSVINSVVFPALKPTLSYSLTKATRWRIKASWVTVIQNNEGTNYPFSYLSVGVGAKVF